MAFIVKQQAMAVMAVTDDLWILPPDDLYIGQVTAAIGLIEHRAYDGGTAGTGLAAFNVAQVNQPLSAKSGCRATSPRPPWPR